MTRIIENPSEQDIRDLTVNDRVVVKLDPARREYEVGLYVDDEGDLITDAGNVVLWSTGRVYFPERIVRIIKSDPVFKWGTVIGSTSKNYRLVYLPDENPSLAPWVGMRLGSVEYWHTNDTAMDLLNNHGWVVINKTEGVES